MKNVQELCDGLHEDEIGEGLFRDLTSYAKTCTVYLTVNENRLDKLKEFKVSLVFKAWRKEY